MSDLEKTLTPPPPHLEGGQSSETAPGPVEQRTKCCTVCGGCGCKKTVPKKYPITILTALWGFLTNVERAIILPTMWLYFSTYWNDEIARTWYGWTMASFSLSVLIFTPVYGYAAHRGIHTKYLIIFANFIEILGNLAYLVAREPWVVLAGRIISGIGGSCDTPMYADLARTTTTEERTPYMTVAFVAKQVGIVFGPACTLMMHKLHWTLGDFKLSVYNGPGLLMAGLWVIHTILVILFYPHVDKPPKNLAKEKAREAAASERDNLIKPGSEKPTGCDSCCPCDSSGLRPYCNYTILSLYVMNFASYFCVMSLETALSPVVNVHFGWDEVNVSYVYLGASGLLIVMCITLHALSKCVEDRRLALVGFILLVGAYIWLFFTTFFIKQLTVFDGAPLLIAGVAIHVIGMPLALAVTESLYTKLVPANDLDRALSYLRCVSNFAFLLGPIEGGVFVDYAFAVFLGNFVICLLGLALLAFKYNRFRPERTTNTGSYEDLKS